MRRPRVADETRDQLRSFIACRLERVHAGARGRGESSLGAGEERRGDDAQNDDGNVEGVRHQTILARPHSGVMRFTGLQLEGASSRARKAETLSSSISRATKLSPMPLTRMKVNLPRSTFLSWRIAASRLTEICLKIRDVAYAGRKADRLQVRLNTPGVLPGAQTQVTGETKRQRHPDGDALAVHQARRIIIRQLLQGMAKRVPKVEQRTLALLRLIGDDDARLSRAADRDRFDSGWSAGEQVAPVRIPETRKSRGRQSVRIWRPRRSRRENRAR